MNKKNASYKRDAANLMMNRLSKVFRQHFEEIKAFSAFQEEVEAQARFNSRFDIGRAFEEFKLKNQTKKVIQEETLPIQRSRNIAKNDPKALQLAQSLKELSHLKPVPRLEHLPARKELEQAPLLTQRLQLSSSDLYGTAFSTAGSEDKENNPKGLNVVLSARNGNGPVTIKREKISLVKAQPTKAPLPAFKVVPRARTANVLKPLQIQSQINDRNHILLNLIVYRELKQAFQVFKTWKKKLPHPYQTPSFDDTSL